MKKSKKIIITIIAIAVLLWGSMFCTDYISCRKMQDPVFARATVTSDDGGSGLYKGLGYTIEIEKHIDPDFGVITDSVEMRLFGALVFAAIT